MPDTETKARRRPWADADIATLVTAYNGGGIEAAHKAFPADIDRVNQKLEELGFIKIDATLKAIIDDLIAEIGKTKPHERMLAARYTIRELQTKVLGHKKGAK